MPNFPATTETKQSLVDQLLCALCEWLESLI